MKIISQNQAVYELITCSLAGKEVQFLHFGPGIWYRINGKELKFMKNPSFLDKTYLLYMKTLIKEKTPE